MSKIYGIVADSGVTRPSKPDGLDVPETTASTLSFVWTLAADAVAWQVYVDGAPFGLQVVAAPVLITDLSPLQTVNLQVQAFNVGGASELSDVFVAITDTNTPPVWSVDDQTGDVGTAYSLDLDTVCNDPDAGQTRTYTIVGGSVPGLGLSADGRRIDGTPTTPGSYSFSVRASDGYSTTDVTIGYTISGADIIAPTTPVISANPVLGSTVSIALDTPSTDASGILHYVIQRADNGGGFVVRQASYTGLWPYVESGVPDGSYEYRIRARDASPNQNLSSFSNTVSVSVSTAPTFPDVPVLAVQRISATENDLTWVAGANGSAPDDYDIQKSTTSATAGFSDIAFSGTGLSYDDTNATNVNTWYRVRAGTGANKSAYCTAVLAPPVGTSRNVYYTCATSGVAGSNTALTNGALYSSKFEPENANGGASGGANVCFTTGNGNSQTGPGQPDFDSNNLTSSQLEQCFLATDTFNGRVISPNTGTKFLRQLMRYQKQYECMNGATAGNPEQKDKPRIKMSLSNTPYLFDWDREILVGFATYTHPDHTMDIATRTHAGGNYHYWVNAGNNLTQFYLTSFGAPLSAPNARWSGAVGGNYESWILGYQANDNAVTDMTQAFSGANTYYVNLGSREADRGFWTNWLWRWRLNPWAGTGTINPSTSIAGAKNKTYTRGKGMCEVWKTIGASRTMVKVCSIFNAPFGGVPSAAELLGQDFGIYNYGWKHNDSSNDGTPGSGPGWKYNAKADIRWGFRKAPSSTASAGAISQFGTSTADVNPTGVHVPFTEQT